MVRRVRDEYRAETLRPRRIENHFVAQPQLPGRVRLIPGHLLKYRPQLRAQLFERPNPLGAVGERGLGWTRRQTVEFIARRHQNSEAGQLREVGGELAECARLRMRAPIVVAIRNALEHASGRRELRFEIGEKKSECGLLLGRLA